METPVPNAMDLLARDGAGTAALPAGNVASEYGALRSGVILVDRSARARTTFTGSAASEVLTGLVTNDVLSLAPGQGQYAALLTPKGKIIADVRIFALEHALLVDTAPRAAMGWWNAVRKFVNPRMARYLDAATSLHDMAAFGIGARDLVGAVVGLSDSDLSALAPYAHRSVTLDGQQAIVARVPDAGVEGFEVFATPEIVRDLWDRAVARGAVPAGPEAFEIARIEAGRPEWGIDMDESTLPQEANLDELHAISYTKGCYTGQETVARVHFRGHVNRHLRGLRFDAATIPLRGVELVDDATGRVVGDVRSVAVSPRLGGIGIGMVRREIGPGATLAAHGAGTVTPVTVNTLPFPL
jgi:folate-binding protein YgfZ